ncbi:MAG: translocation/assembly module TamB domain-containing protein, partial [Sediminibacterium sp.]
QIDSIQFNGYTYAQIQTNGILQKQAYNGSIKIKDPNINFISNLEVDFKQNTPTFNAVGDLTNANLSALQFSKNKIQLTGLLDVNFTGSNIDNFIGSAKFYNGKLKSSSNTINFDSVSLKSTITNGNKQIILSSDEIQASISGKFNIDQLPNSVQYFLQGYFPNYIKNLKEAPVNQQFSFQVNTAYFEPYIRIFRDEFSGFNNMFVNGNINTDKQSLQLESKIPYAQWNNYAISNGMIGGTGNKDSLKLNLVANSFNLTDSLKLISPKLRITTSKDQSLFNLNAESKSALSYISFEGKVNTYTDGLSVQWAPSFFVLNEKKWTIQNRGEISLRKNNTYAKQFTVSQGLQKISVLNHPNDVNGLQVKLEEVILGDITNLFFSYPKLEGITNATVNLNQINDQFSLNINSTINQFSFNSTLLGNTTVNAAYDDNTGIVPFDLNCPNSSYHLAAKGSYAIKDSINPLDATLTLQESDFGLIQEFIGGVLTDLKGKATGAIHFGGRIENPDLRGVATIKDAAFKVDYTKVNYYLPTATIAFTDEGIDFGTIQVKDKLNRVAQFKGKILHQRFKHLVYDMDMQSSKIELLNTDVIDNSSFYGQAVGKASMTIRGPEENIKMSMNVEVNDSSHIYLPNATSKETGQSEFIVFKKLGKSIISNAETPTFNLLVDLDVSADNKTQIDVILDDLTGDVIKAVGNGRLKIKAGNIEPLTMRGKYNIEKGKYDFNFQSIIKKPFDLIPEAGNFIEWTGNPYEANIHVDARYTAERVSLNELVGNANFSNAVKSYRGNVYVIAALRNKLARPDIQFTLAFPPGNPISTDNEFSQFIVRLERDDNEIIKQVSFLIVFNSFAPVGFNSGNSNNAYSVTTLGINSISQLLTKEINKSVTNLLNKVTGDQSLRFDIGSNVYNSGNLLDPTGAGIAINSNKIDRQRVNLKLGRSFFNDKVIVNLGGDFDFNLRSASSIENNNFQWLPDLNIEFILTKD